MKIHHFIIEGLDFDLGVIDDTGVVSQIRRVLKLKRDEIIWLGDNNNRAVIARIKDFNDKQISFDIESRIDEVENVTGRLVIACSVLKKESFELVVQKTTELGVSEIVPFISARTVKTGLRYDRLATIAREASEQAGRGIVPLVREAVDFDKLSEMFADFKNKYICHISDDNDIEPKKDTGDTVVVVGPEGGFEDREVELLKDAGFKILSLSNFTLRAETATIVAVSKIA